MRTTLNIDDAALREVKAICETEGRPMGAVVSALLAEALAGRRAPRSRPRFRWVSRPMNARVDLADRDAASAALDAR